MTIYHELKTRIKKEAQVIMVLTVLEVGVKVTKKAACEMIDILERRMIEPKVTFTEIGNGKYVVVIERNRP